MNPDVPMVELSGCLVVGMLPLRDDQAAVAVGELVVAEAVRTGVRGVILDIEAIGSVDSRVVGTVNAIGIRLRSAAVDCVVVDGRSAMQRFRDDQRERSRLDTVDSLDDALACLR
ncbi:hypothetical protein [Rhodococcus sp. NPDC127528]|uniref:hypothetical protein n=1 Tax=unclassified Rhodococcus (in: high G+C Gram-positive bacteria) TaxID=192944 RepID=UPI00363D090A